jgi:hypothetical protein
MIILVTHQQQNGYSCKKMKDGWGDQFICANIETFLFESVCKE